MKLLLTIAALFISTSVFAQEHTESVPEPNYIVPNTAPAEVDPVVQEVTKDWVENQKTQNDNPPGVYSQPADTTTPDYFNASLVVKSEPHTQVAPTLPAKPRFRWFGLQLDAGAPDGVALGVIVRPSLNWLRLNASGTWNYLSYGVRGGLTLDPINFPIAPTLTVEGGHFFYGTIPSEQLQVSYDYLNLHGGLDFGKRDVIRFFIHGGVSYMNVYTKNFSTLFNHSDTITLSDPTFSVRAAPSLKVGIFYLF